MNQTDRTLKLQNWLVDNFEDWSTICGMGKHPISEKEYRRLSKLLIDNDFEEMTLVLFTCHFYAVEMTSK